MPGGDQRSLAQRQLGGRGVARVARPRLEVSRSLGTARPLQLQLDPQPRAQRCAVVLVVVGVIPKPVIDVNRSYRGGAEQANREVEQADRIAATGEHRDQWRAGRQQTVLVNRIEHPLALHALSVARRGLRCALCTHGGAKDAPEGQSAAVTT